MCRTRTMRMARRAVAVATRRRMSTSSSSTGLSQATRDAFKHCSEVVKRGDYDGYLYSQLQRKDRRQSSLVLRAFNVETAGIKDSVRSNVIAGRMRMQWWKDSLADIFADDPPVLPIAVALAEVLYQQSFQPTGGLTRRWFDRILDARMADLESSQPTSIAEMETYAENTASSLIYLHLELNGVRAGGTKEIPGLNEIGHAASHIGKAAGMCTLLRSLTQPKPSQSVHTGGAPMEACILPSEVMRKHGLSYPVLVRGPKTEAEAYAVAGSVFDVARVAKGHMDASAPLLMAAREKAKGYLPPGAFGALLPGVRALWYLEKLEECEFNPFDERLSPRSPLRFQLRLAKAVWVEEFSW